MSELRRADVGGGQAADGDHLLLDLGEGGQDLVLVRRRRLVGRRVARSVGDSAGETDAWRTRIGGDATAGQVEDDDRDPDHDDDGDDDGGQALGSGHCGAFCHGIAGIPERSGFLRCGKPGV